MEYRQLGVDGPLVSAIGLGFWSIGGAFGPADLSEARRTVARAVELGATHFDTAPVYGESEVFLGDVIAAFDRSQLFVTTKCGLAPDPHTGKPILDSRPAALRRHIEASLRRLRCTWVDLLLIHWPDPTVPIAEAIGGLDDLRREGFTRYIGVSNFSAQQLREACQVATIACNQVGHHLFDRRWEHEMFATAAELGVAITSYSPLSQGLLSGSFDKHVLHPDDWRLKGDTLSSQNLFAAENVEHNIALTHQMANILQGSGVALPQAAIAWVLANPQVASVITGSRHVARLEENIAALDVALPPHIWDQLSALAAAAHGQHDTLPTWPVERQSGLS